MSIEAERAETFAASARGRRAWTERELLDSIRAAADELGRPPTAPWWAAHSSAWGLPSGRTLTMRFGSWNDALAAAGLPVREATGDYRWRRDRESLLGDVAAAARALGRLPSIAEYRRYRAAHPEMRLASDPTVRQHLGGWAGALAELEEGGWS